MYTVSILRRAEEMREMYSENLKRCRTEEGLTQKELSEKSGVSRSLINEIESGTRDIVNAKTLKKLAAALNRKVGDIFDGL